MKIKLWVAILNSGDGSVNLRFYNTMEEAEEEADTESEPFCENVQKIILEVDRKGELVTPTPTL